MLAFLRADVDSTATGLRTEMNLRFADRDKRTDKAIEKNWDCAVAPRLIRIQDPVCLRWDPIFRIEHYAISPNQVERRSAYNQDLKELKLKAFAVIWSKMLLCD